MGIYPMICHYGGLFHRSDRNAPALQKWHCPRSAQPSAQRKAWSKPARQHDRFSIHAYNGQRYHNDHHQLKATEIPIGIKDLRVETVKLGQSMHSADINLSSMRNRFHQQHGVALNNDLSPAIGKSEHQHPWMPVTPESPVIQLPDVPPLPTYNGQRYHSDHRQLKAAEIPIGIKDLRAEAETVRLGQSMHSADINISSMRNRFQQQHGVALNNDLSTTIGKSEHQHPWMPVTRTVSHLIILRPRSGSRSTSILGCLSLQSHQLFSYRMYHHYLPTMVNVTTAIIANSKLRRFPSASKI
jgi:hypothetical protein